MRIARPFTLLICLFAISLPTFARERLVAITVDDLPYISGTDRALSGSDLPAAEQANSKLLSSFESHHVPVTGFVIEQSVESLGINGATKILQEWLAKGLDLGNHSHSHPDINNLSVAQIEDEVLRGEATFVPLMKQHGKKNLFFRFPMNHTGDTQQKHDAIAAFLMKRGYRLAASTIDTSDYVFNAAYVRMLAKGDVAAAGRLRTEYLAYTSSEIDYYAALNEKVLGYEPPEVILLHDNRLNADGISDVLNLFQQKGYRFVSLTKAQSDPAYAIPDTYITKYGPVWGYRWAHERNVQVDGRLEQEPAQWVLDYGKTN